MPGSEFQVLRLHLNFPWEFSLRYIPNELGLVFFQLKIRISARHQNINNNCINILIQEDNTV